MESEDISTACEWKYRGATSSEAVGGYESENDITEKMGIFPYKLYTAALYTG